MAKRLQQIADTMAPPMPHYELNENGIPPFEALPLQKDAPMYSAWGLYGEHDELGTLNRLTDEKVAAAAKSEIRTGVRYLHQRSPTTPLNTHQSSRLTRFQSLPKLAPRRPVQGVLLRPPALPPGAVPQAAADRQRRRLDLQHAGVEPVGRAPALRVPEGEEVL